MHMSVLLITHDLGVVAEMACRVVVMYAGQLVELGDVADIFSHPLHPYTRGLLMAVPKVSGGRQRLYIIPGTVPSAYDYSEGCRFFGRCDICDEACSLEPPPLLNIGSRQVRCHHIL
jgi:peptide/nickel transport system ATP-binding protein/oligopeptide transport system ATP-binding protein